jgi:hypothetical protein
MTVISSILETQENTPSLIIKSIHYMSPELHFCYLVLQWTPKLGKNRKSIGFFQILGSQMTSHGTIRLLDIHISHLKYE